MNTDKSDQPRATTPSRPYHPSFVSCGYLSQKFETRSTKFETSTNFQNPNSPNRKVWNFEFRILDLFRVSIFGFRISPPRLYLPRDPRLLISTSPGSPLGFSRVPDRWRGGSIPGARGGRCRPRPGRAAWPGRRGGRRPRRNFFHSSYSRSKTWLKGKTVRPIFFSQDSDQPPTLALPRKGGRV
jgi:hypothetical protein